MKYFKLFFCYFIVFLNVSKSYSQELHPFIITLDTVNNFFSVPILSLLDPLSDKISDRMDFPFSKSTPFQALVTLSKPVFLNVVNVSVLAIPKKKMKGLIKNDGNELVIYDSSDINNLLLGINDTCNLIFKKFGSNTTYEQYYKMYDTLNKYIAKCKKHINSAEALDKYTLTKASQTAAIEFCTVNFSQHIIYPILFNSGIQRKTYTLIRKSVKVEYPDYWLQLQAGRIFLKTYFFKVLLPKYKNDINKIFESEYLYRNPNIKRHVGYHYFLSLLYNDTSFHEYSEVVKNIEQFEKKYDCGANDIIKFEKIKIQFLKKGNDITQLFNQQELVNYSNGKLKGEKFGLLKNQGKLIIYYWASWCIPCLETMNNLKKTIAEYEGEQYKILFISIDKKHESWKKVKLNLLTPINSYRLNDFSSSSFYTVFQITQVPRLFLIDDGRLIETNFSKAKFDKIFSQ